MAIKHKSTLERDKSSIAHQLTMNKSKKSETDRSLGNWKKEVEILRGQISEKEKSLAAVQTRMHERADRLRSEEAELERINDDVYREFCAELKIANISEFEGGSLKEHKARTETLFELNSQVGKIQDIIQKLRYQEKTAAEQEKVKMEEVEKIKREIDGHKSEKKTMEKAVR